MFIFFVKLANLGPRGIYYILLAGVCVGVYQNGAVDEDGVTLLIQYALIVFMSQYIQRNLSPKLIEGYRIRYYTEDDSDSSDGSDDEDYEWVAEDDHIDVDYDDADTEPQVDTGADSTVNEPADDSTDPTVNDVDVPIEEG